MPQNIEARAENFIQTDTPFLRVIPNQQDLEQAPANVIFAEDRFTSKDKSATFPSSGTINFNKDFARIEQIEKSFEGQTTPAGRRYMRAHDPALDRADFERCQTDEQRHLFRGHLVKLMETTLRERAETIESQVVFILDDQGNAYNEKFPREPVDIMIQRGVEYRKKEGSPDYQRDQSGLEGWVQIRQEVANPLTPEYTKWYIISEPEQVENTTFTKNFVDAHEKVWDAQRQKWTIVLTRFSSSTSHEDYAKIANELNPGYFVGQDGIQEASSLYFASHPIRIDVIDPRSVSEIFGQEFNIQQGAAEENKFRSWWTECTAIAEHYTDAICAKFFDPEKVKLTFNALLNKFDRVRKGIVETSRNILNKISDLGRQILNTARHVWDEINYLGRLPVEVIRVGCGLLAGFSIGGRFSLGSILEGFKDITLRILKGSDKYGSLEFDCPKCKKTNRRPHNTLISNCQHCQADVTC